MAHNTPPPINPPAGGSGSGSGDDDELDDKFMDDDLETVPPHAEHYGYGEDDPLPIARIFIGGLLILAILAGIIYLAYARGVQDGQKNLPPVVLADKKPVKVPPQSTGKTDKFDRGELNIYDKIQTKPAKRVDEKSGNGQVESLYGAKPPKGKDKAVDKPNISAPKAVEKPVKAKPKPTVPKLAKPVKPLPSAVPTGEFIVQVSSTRDAAQAKAQYAALAERFPDLFTGHEPMVQRADLGARGIFFRLGVAGFATRKAAQDFCTTLKSRGQDCLVRTVD